MNLSRLRELHAAWRDGSIRAAELAELRDMLPEVIEAAEVPSHNDAMKEAERVLESFVPDRSGEVWKHAGTGLVIIMIAMGIRRDHRLPK